MGRKLRREEEQFELTLNIFQFKMKNNKKGLGVFMVALKLTITKSGPLYKE